MKIILVVTNTCGKNLVFVSDLLKTLSLVEAIRAADKGLFQNVYSVNGTSGAYLRSTPNISEKDNLDTLSVTAADIIVTKKGLYNPNPKDKKLPFRGVLSNKDREYLYRYVVEPNHNIRFAAAYIRDIINVWAKYIDLTKRPEIIATLYSKGYGDPKSNPITSKRGTQIMEEFYPLVKKWISNT